MLPCARAEEMEGLRDTSIRERVERVGEYVFHGIETAHYL